AKLSRVSSGRAKRLVDFGLLPACSRTRRQVGGDPFLSCG
ncbi:MAG: hypothetical protein ACKVHP_25660, partial [Verrucomicrobiales bacterium]